MKPLTLLFVLLFSLSAAAQENKKKRMPLFVTHLSAENKAITKRPGNSKHHFFSKIICFKKKCRNYIGWRTGQRKMRFKGYKDGGIPPTPREQKLLIDKDTVLATASPLPPTATVKVKQDTATSTVDLKQLFVLDEVLFEVNSAELNKNFTFRLDSLVTILTKHSTLKAQVSGHTDNTGDESFNIKLSRARAQAVAQYLVKHNISAKRITFMGLGSATPLYTNQTEDGRKRNRRVEILIIGQ